VKNYLKKFVNSWDKLKPKEIQLKRLSGLSNIVFAAEAMNDFFEEGNLSKPKHVVAKLKLRNAVDDNSFNPYTESSQSYLESQRIGPLVIHDDDAIKIQEYVYNIPMTRDNMCQQNYRLWMMMPLADFLDNDAPKKDFGGKPNIKHLIEDFNLTTKLRQKLVEHKLTEQEQLTMKDAIKCLSQSEEDYIMSLLGPDFKEEDLYLVHGDCYYCNALYDYKNKMLKYIDFEYACLNPFFSDVANIINETVFDYAVTKYPHFTYDKSSYPKNDDVREMIRALLMFWDNKNIRFEKIETAEEFETKLKACPEYHQISDKRVEEALLLTKKCAVLNNYYYLLWCFCDLRNTDFDLDYILYARDRATTYFKSKADLQEYIDAQKDKVK